MREINVRRLFWMSKTRPGWVEVGESLSVILVVTFLGWRLPVTYHVLGQVYLVVVMLLSIRVRASVVLGAAIFSAIVWDYVFIPPRMAFSVLDTDDVALLVTYLIGAVFGGLLVRRLRTIEGEERQREQQAAALFLLSKEIAGARTLDETAKRALIEAEEFIGGETALLLADESGILTAHPAGSFRLSPQELLRARQVFDACVSEGAASAAQTTGTVLFIPLQRADLVLGVLAVNLPRELAEVSEGQRDLLLGFAALLAMLVERERLAAERERERLRTESDRLHRNLLDSVSHELKTPMAVLRTAVGRVNTPDPEERLVLVGEMRLATQRLDRLVSNLLNQTRLESGRLTAQRDWCEVQELIGAARRSLGDLLEHHEVTTHVPENLPLLMADALLFEQALANLLINAALHTPPGTRVSVTVRHEPEAGEIEIEVADNGPGLPPDLEARLFQRFSRGAVKRSGGLGLGLSIVKGFMEAQGGRVETRKRESGGACLVLCLPARTHAHVPSDEHEKPSV